MQKKRKGLEYAQAFIIYLTINYLISEVPVGPTVQDHQP